MTIWLCFRKWHDSMTCNCTCEDWGYEIQIQNIITLDISNNSVESVGPAGYYVPFNFKNNHSIKMMKKSSITGALWWRWCCRHFGKCFFSFCLLIAKKLRQIKITNDSSFFILTAGFYVLHGYTSLKSVVKVQGDNDLAVSFFQSSKLNQVNSKGPAAVPYKDYANQTPEKNDNNNDCRSESQAKRNPVTTICKFDVQSKLLRVDFSVSTFLDKSLT